MNTNTTKRNMKATAKAGTKATGPTLVAAAHAGTVNFYKVRTNGSVRHWPVLAPKSKERKQAEGWAAKRQAGSTVAAIAKEAKQSVPTIRRGLTALAFTTELEQAKPAALTAIAKEVTVAEKSTKATKAPAKKAPAKAKSTKKAPAKSAKAKANAHAKKNSTVGRAVAKAAK